jgi:hypothetical protein
MILRRSLIQKIPRTVAIIVQGVWLLGMILDNGHRVPYHCPASRMMMRLPSECLLDRGIPFVVCSDDGSVKPVEVAGIGELGFTGVAAVYALIRGRAPGDWFAQQVNLFLNFGGVLTLANVLFRSGLGPLGYVLLISAPVLFPMGDVTCDYRSGLYGLWCLSLAAALLLLFSFRESRIRIRSVVASIAIIGFCYLFREPFALIYFWVALGWMGYLLVIRRVHDRRTIVTCVLLSAGILFLNLTPRLILSARNWAYQIPPTDGSGRHGVAHVIVMSIGTPGNVNKWGMTRNDVAFMRVAQRTNPKVEHNSNEMIELLFDALVRMVISDPVEMVRVYRVAVWETLSAPRRLGPFFVTLALSLMANLVFFMRGTRKDPRYRLIPFFTGAGILGLSQGVLANFTYADVAEVCFVLAVCLALFALGTELKRHQANFGCKWT